MCFSYLGPTLVHHPQKASCRVPVADRHALVDGHRDDMAEATLRSLAGEPRVVQHSASGVDLVHTFLRRDLLEGGDRGEGFLQEDHVVSVLLGIRSVTLWRLLDRG